MHGALSCEWRTSHSDTARSWRRKSVGYARHGLPRGQAEAGIRSGPALATGRAIGGRTAWYRWVGGLHPLNLMQLGASLRSNQAGPRDDERPPDMGHPRRCCVGRRCRGALWALRRGGRLRWPRRHRHLTVRRGGRGGRCGAGCLRLRSDERASADRTEALWGVGAARCLRRGPRPRRSLPCFRLVFGAHRGEQNQAASRQ